MEVWPENWPAVDLFGSLRTQWYESFAGKTGLNYASVWTLIERRGLTREEEDDLFADVQHLELEALSAMYEDD